MKVDMSNIGHNHRPLENRIFDDPSVSVEDVLEAVSARIQRTNDEILTTLTEAAKALSGNKERLPASFCDADIMTALELLSHISKHNEKVDEQKGQMLTAVKEFTSTLDALCKPLNEGLKDLEKIVRERMQTAYLASVDQHNEERSESETPMTSLTLRAPSGAKATLIIGEDIDIQSAADIPRKFLTPDLKLLAAAVKKGEKVPGVEKKRKPSLRVST